MIKPPDQWKDSRGPVGAIHLTAKRMGWKWGTPYSFVNDLGQEIQLKKVSPKMLQWHVHQTHMRAMQKKYTERWYDGKDGVVGVPTVTRNTVPGEIALNAHDQHMLNTSEEHHKRLEAFSNWRYPYTHEQQRIGKLSKTKER